MDIHHDLQTPREGQPEPTSLRQENDKLRLLLATSNANCAYCGLPAEAMAKCANGFPGCARADDMLFDGTPTRQDLIEEQESLRRQNAALRGALEKWQAHMKLGKKPAEISYGDLMLSLTAAEEATVAALSLTPASPDDTRGKAELLDWLIKKGFQHAEAGLGGGHGEEWVNFKIWFQVPEPKGWPLYEDAEWNEEQILAALRAAKAGGK